MQKVMMMAVLMTGLFFFGAGQVKAQADCKSLVARSKKQRDCWVKKVIDGEKNLAGAYLKDAYLFRVDLSGANLSGANLSRANLIDVDLTKVNLRDADLSGATLSGADLSGAILSGAILTDAIVYRPTTKGVDFDDWIKRGGIVED